MTTENTTQANAANVRSGTEGAHDRVAMLSLKADGTPDQIAPEIIGDPKFAEEATKRQFAEQAVSVADEARRAQEADVASVKQDPGIAATQKEHQKLATAAEKSATEVVKQLHKG